MKYGNKKVFALGLEFDSKLEAMRYKELSLLEKAGEITDLNRQVKYELIPSQRVNGKVVERPVSYIADFVYQTKNGEIIVEDTKGYLTREYVLKRKLMLFIKGIKIQEITGSRRKTV